MAKDASEEVEIPGLKGDIKAVLSQISCAGLNLKHPPRLDEIVAFGQPHGLNYAGRAQEIEEVLKAAEKRGYVRTNERGQYFVKSKGKKLEPFCHFIEQ